MKKGQKLLNDNKNQVALFPLQGFIISQGWFENYSHYSSIYYATDFLATNESGARVFRGECYAPVDIKLLWKDPIECCALWQSVEKVYFADGSTDYLGIICYHDNDISNGSYSNVGDIKLQGEVFNRSGTGGNVTGDHVHIETGKGEVVLGQSNWHFKDSSSCKRITPDKVFFVNDTFVTNYKNYSWSKFDGGYVPPDPGPTPPEPKPGKNNKKWGYRKMKKIIKIY